MSTITTIQSTDIVRDSREDINNNFNALNNDKYEQGNDAVLNSVQLQGGTGDQGKMTWNTDELTLDLVQNGSTLQLGQETQFNVRNTSGSTISNGTPVMATGTIGNSGRITIAPMVSSVTSNAKYYLGIATEDIANGSDGKITNFGKVRSLDTTGTLSFGGLETWTDGQVLWLDTTNDGYLTNVEPTTGMKIATAFIIHAHANGTLFSRVTPINEDFYTKSESDAKYVDLTTNQTIGGNKKFTGDIEIEQTTGSALIIDKNSTGTSLQIDSEATDSHVLQVDGVNTGKSLIYAVASGANTAAFGSVVRFQATNASHSNPVVRIDNAGSGTGIQVKGSGASIGLDDMTAPGTTTNKLYAVGGNLFWNAIQLDGGGGGSSSAPQFNINIDGPQIVGALYTYVCNGAVTAGTFRASLGVKPTGSDFIIKLFKNGVEDAAVTIATTDTATNGLFQGTDTTFVSGSYVAGDVLTVEVTQIGSSVAGSDLTVGLFE